jgi:hypothetical protein
MPDFLGWLNGQVPEMTAQGRHLQAGLRADQRRELREERDAEAARQQNLERQERKALAARQLGVDPGALTEAVTALHERQGKVNDLTDQLDKAVRRRDSARSQVEYVTRMLGQAEAMASGNPELPEGLYPLEVYPPGASRSARPGRELTTANWYHAND